MAEWWQDFFLSGSYTLLADIPQELTAKQVAFAQRELNLQSGMHVLDLACGIGRHSLPLALQGTHMVGLDYTPDYVRQAGQNSGGRPARFVRGDMRILPFADGAFDAAISMFGSFGYFDDPEDDSRVLKELARVLKPNAPLLLDVLHRDGMARAFEPSRREDFSDGYVEESRSWNARTGQIHSDWTFRRGEEAKTYGATVRLYTCTELERKFANAGFEVERIWGDWDGAALDFYHHAVILTAHKRAIPDSCTIDVAN